MTLPFEKNQKWFTVWGGGTKKLNQHHENRAQKFAHDWIILDEKRKSFKNEGKQNTDYYCYGKKILAPSNAKVVQVVNGVKDNEPAYLNGYFAAGNCVVLEINKDLYCFIAHFMNDSIEFKVGQKVKQGDIIGLVGNTGNSTEPHIHMHFQDQENILFANAIDTNFSEFMSSKMNVTCV